MTTLGAYNSKTALLIFLYYQMLISMIRRVHRVQSKKILINFLVALRLVFTVSQLSHAEKNQEKPSGPEQRRFIRNIWARYMGY